MICRPTIDVVIVARFITIILTTLVVASTTKGRFDDHATNIFSRGAAPGDEVKAENEGSPTSPISRDAPPYDEEHPGPPESH